MYQFILDLIEFIKGLNMFSTVAIYRNEFQQGVDWNPSFPACLVRMNIAQTDVMSAEGSSLHTKATFILYVGGRLVNDATTNALSLAFQLFDELESVQTDDGYMITQDNIQFVETGFGIDLYSIQITVKK